ncbi:arginine N-succinyltransferase [Halopseudomonas bauzanensis]|uniref:Arginine N-succinyltransferase n=1 Tax=Halopseudomonas bauzanensis TaxID=653930 RepID=A0A1H9VBN8_9GAMM|nr:arginine N-succinyltransferase [Halopseudomonas bauzanensis]TKA92447.1 arginine N-succinyltransferase [Halopseudomonas bauzanensis]SES19102.1 arginine succinyltransferase [Halopseudomonas bauzanensis]SFM16886.1 arginine N-succinyltransferase [Halopseudomonas bauzanensis]
MLVRAARMDDLPALLELASGVGSGLTSLPASEERLSRRLQTVAASFAGELPNADADYLFVLEDGDGQVVGTSGMVAAAGLREPWYSYRVGLTVTANRELDVYRQQPTLFLNNDLTGATALCSLYLSVPHRHSLNGRLLSKARFIHMAEFGNDFSPRIIAEIRGLSDRQGRSPFWDSLGRHFFRMDFARADYLTGTGSKTFIAEMMPKFPLYTCFLSQEARDAIARVHPDSEPALAMLTEEGLNYQGYIDIFDGGITIEAPRNQVRSIHESQQLILATGTPGDDAQTYLVHNRERDKCRITAAAGRIAAGSLVVAPETAELLRLRAGAPVRAVALVGAADGVADPYAGMS